MSSAPGAPGAPARRPRVMAYSHDGFGLGHLRRNLGLVNALLGECPDASVLMVTGSPASHSFPFPPQVDNIKLPSLAKLANDNYVSRPLGLDRDEVARLRAAIMRAAVEEFRPDLVLVDFYPLGVNRDLEPALRHVRATLPATRIVLGWRDILDDPRQVQREWWDTGQIGAVDELFDRVLIYGCQELYDPFSEYGLPPVLAARTTFTGYLVGEEPERRPARPAEGPTVVCTLGGGEDGVPVAWTFLEAMGELGREGWRGRLVTGPLMAAGDLRAVRAAATEAGVACDAFVEDLVCVLAEADVVVAMAGYNTLCEVLATRTPAVVIPRTLPRQEQLLRATRFAGLGLVRALLPPEVNGARLAALVREQAGVSRDEVGRRVTAGLRVGGLAVAAQVLAGCGTPAEALTGQV